MSYVIWFLAYIHIPQKDIAAASGVTEVTIRNRFKELKRLLESR
jgi:transcription initiation factor TFIIIB Brf1 subunit/transcription initiation factor TFIIB